MIAGHCDDRRSCTYHVPYRQIIYICRLRQHLQSIKLHPCMGHIHFANFRYTMQHHVTSDRAIFFVCMLRTMHCTCRYIYREQLIKLMQYHMHDTMFIPFCPKSAWPGSSTFARLVMQLSLDELCERFYWTCRWRLQPFAWQKNGRADNATICTARTQCLFHIVMDMHQVMVLGGDVEIAKCSLEAEFGAGHEVVKINLQKVRSVLTFIICQQRLSATSPILCAKDASQKVINGPSRDVRLL